MAGLDEASSARAGDHPDCVADTILPPILSGAIHLGPICIVQSRLDAAVKEAATFGLDQPDPATVQERAFQEVREPGTNPRPCSVRSPWTSRVEVECHNPGPPVVKKANCDVPAPGERSGDRLSHFGADHQPDPAFPSAERDAQKDRACGVLMNVTARHKCSQPPPGQTLVLFAPMSLLLLAGLGSIPCRAGRQQPAHDAERRRYRRARGARVIAQRSTGGETRQFTRRLSRPP